MNQNEGQVHIGKYDERNASVLLLFRVIILRIFFCFFVFFVFFGFLLCYLFVAFSHRGLFINFCSGEPLL